MEKHILGTVENDKIYHEKLRDKFFSGATSSSLPSLTVVVGQPGAGKSTFINRILASSSKGDKPTLLDHDELRILHPLTSHYKTVTPLTYATLTYPDIKIWFAKLETQARANKINLVIPLCAEDREDFVEKLRAYKAAGYKIALEVLSTDFVTSQLNIVVRCESETSKREYARTVSKEIHEKSYLEIPETLNLIDSMKLADSIVIYSRSGDVIYRNALSDGEWQAHPESCQALLTERRRPLSEPERLTQCAKSQDVVGLIAGSVDTWNSEQNRAVVELTKQICRITPQTEIGRSPFGKTPADVD